MTTSDGRTSIPSGELPSPSTKKPQQNRPSVGARGFEPLSPNLERKASTKHNTEAGRPKPKSELLALAQKFHEAYERLAPAFGYKTREESAVPWSDVPLQNKMLMEEVVREVCGPLLDTIAFLGVEVGE